MRTFLYVLAVFFGIICGLLCLAAAIGFCLAVTKVIVGRIELGAGITMAVALLLVALLFGWLAWRMRRRLNEPDKRTAKHISVATLLLFTVAAVGMVVTGGHSRGRNASSDRIVEIAATCIGALLLVLVYRYVSRRLDGSQYPRQADSRPH